MGKFSRKYKRKEVVENRKAMSRLLKKQGVDGMRRLLSGVDYYGTKEDKEFVGTLDVAEQEGAEVQGPQEGTEQEVVSPQSDP